MNRYRLAGVAAFAAFTAPMSAYALNIDFSFTGGGAGVVTGEIVGLAATGQSGATDIYIDGVPSSFGTPAVPIDLLAKIGHGPTTNSFSVSNGAIVKYSFRASVTNPHSIGLVLYPGGPEYFSNGHLTIKHGGVVTFTPVGAAAVPEPPAIALLGAGLAGISAFRRRRNVVA